jgi:hypothetical protein
LHSKVIMRRLLPLQGVVVDDDLRDNANCYKGTPGLTISAECILAMHGHSIGPV